MSDQPCLVIVNIKAGLAIEEEWGKNWQLANVNCSSVFLWMGESKPETATQRIRADANITAAWGRVFVFSLGIQKHKLADVFTQFFFRTLEFDIIINKFLVEIAKVLQSIRI